MNAPTSAPGPGATGSRRETHRMAGIKHDTCSKPAMSITGDPWSTTGSSAARSPCRSTQLLLPPDGRARRPSCCAASKTCPTRQLVDCSLILGASASTPHVTRAPCSQHVPHESGSICGRNQGVQRGVADACALGGAKGACRGIVLCMLVVARANALRSARQMQTLQTTFICLSLSTEGAS